MRKAFIIGGTIIALVIVINLTNILNKHKVQDNITVTAKSSIKIGSVWYVNNDMILDKSFKRGFSSPKLGDSIDIGLNDQGIAVDWKVNN